MAYSVDKARELVLKAGLELCEAGLVARTWGNISARVSDTQYVITPSGRAYETLTKEDIVLVNIADGTFEGNVKPSGEKGVHAAVYELCPEMNFVIHTHQNYASALSVLAKEIPVEMCKESNVLCEKKTDEEILGNVIPCADYGMYATELLVNNVKEQVRTHKDSKAVLMKYHGALCYGKDYDEAFAVAYELEKVSKKVFDELCKEGAINRVGVRYGEETINVGNKEKEGVSKDKWCELLSELKILLENRDGIKAVALVQTPFIMKMSLLGKTMYPYLDDAAQIAGVDVKCIAIEDSYGLNNATEVVTDGKCLVDSLQDRKMVTEKSVDALQDRNAVFIKGLGAICTGFDESEAEAVGIVLEKACMAAYLAESVGDIAPLDAESAKLDREGYVNHYSKLK